MLEIHSDAMDQSTDVELMMKQLNFMMVGSELLWSLWAITRDDELFIDLSEYLRVKSGSYLRKKEMFQDDIEVLVKQSENS